MSKFISPMKTPAVPVPKPEPSIPAVTGGLEGFRKTKALKPVVKVKLKGK